MHVTEGHVVNEQTLQGHYHLQEGGKVQKKKKKNAFVGNVCVPSKFTWALLWVVMVSIPGKGVYKHADTLKYSESKMIEPST